MYDRIVDVPRLVAFYEEGALLPVPVLEEVKDVLGERYRDEGAGPLRTAGVCLYRTGRDSVAWHGDTIGRTSGDDTLVAIVSLGTPRRFLLRSKSGGPTHRFNLGHGDLLVMGGSCQRTCEHSVPKSARAWAPVSACSSGPPGSADRRPGGTLGVNVGSGRQHGEHDRPGRALGGTTMAQSAGLHESEQLLSSAAVDRHRAIVSIQEELEAVDWYDQRVEATTDESLATVLAHNRDEEKEHAAMTIEWLRRNDPVLDGHLRTYLFTSEPVTAVEAEAEGGSSGTGPGDGSLGIGCLRS